MNPQALKAFFEKNKKGLAVVVLGLVAKRGKDSQPAAATPASSSLSAGGAPTSSTPIASQYTGGGTYDSTASDVYGALAPMLERTNALLTQQNTPIPVAVAPGFYGRAGGTGIYQVDAAGNRDHLGMEEYLALGAPAYKAVARDDSFWTNTKAVGADNGTWN